MRNVTLRVQTTVHDLRMDKFARIESGLVRVRPWIEARQGTHPVRLGGIQAKIRIYLRETN